MGRITQAILAAKDDFSKKLYFKEDIELLILKLRECIGKNASDTEQTVRSQIIKMFKSNGIECERTATPDRYYEQLQLSTIPSIKEFPKLCWEELIKLNTVYKSPKDYMSRLVNNLVDPEYDIPDSPIRVKILKQILGKLDNLQGTRFYSPKLISIIEKEYEGVISNIDDHIFEKYLSPKHFEEPHKYLKVLLDVYGDLLYSNNETDDYLTSLVLKFDSSAKGKTAYELLKLIRLNNPEEKLDEKGKKISSYNILDYSKALVEEIKEYLDDVLTKYKKEFDADFTEINLTKNRADQFRLIADFVHKRGLYGYIYTDEFEILVEQITKAKISADYVEKALFEELSLKATGDPRSFAKINKYIIKQIRAFKTEINKKFKQGKDNIKGKSSVPEILYICNDLSEGKYKTNSEMKEILYLFAFAFDMSVCVDSTNSDSFKDIKKNLFEDFYCDNILRYVNNYQLVGRYEEPTGITIQYKNFVEIVYLYWLNKDSSIFSPAKKYISANEMINKIVSIHKSAERTVTRSTEKSGKEYFEAKRIAERKAKGTYVYRNYYEGVEILGDYGLNVGNLLSMPQQDFQKFVIDNYDIDTRKRYNITEAFENQNYQEQAETSFNWIINELRNNNPKFKKEQDISLVDCYYSLEFYEAVYNSLYAEKETDLSAHRQLSALIKKTNDQIKHVLLDIEADDYNVYTRTRYMYLYYNWFIQKHLGKSYNETFDDFCDEYCEQLNTDLEVCSYQLFSDKNLIDVLLLYSAFIALRTSDE